MHLNTIMGIIAAVFQTTVISHFHFFISLEVKFQLLFENLTFILNTQ